MNDFAETLAAKSDQINNADLAGSPMTIKITKVVVNKNEAQKVSISFEGSDKVFRPCLGMRRLMAEIWGADPKVFIGRLLTLYRDPEVTYGKGVTGGTRISHMSNIDRTRTVVVPIRRGQVKEYTVLPMANLTVNTPKPKPDDTPPVSTQPEFDPMPQARDAATKGKAAFTAWWNGDGKQYRDQVKPNMAELTELAAKADAPPPDDDLPM
jgi:hypothetical protein